MPIETIQRLLVALAATVLAAPAALAQQPHKWQLGVQDAATPVMREMDAFHDLLLVIVTAIAVLVLTLLLYVIWRFRSGRNPTPSGTTHNTLIEVLWTAVPVLILVFIAIPSLRLLFFTDEVADADMTIKAIGRQWYWTYEYPDHGDFAFDAFIVSDEDLSPGQPRLLETDNRVVVPVGKKIRLITTSSDVLHAWAVPAFGVKIDSVPGRLNETWFLVEKPGVYYGQCSELCGTGHGFMPIAVEAMSEARFETWVEEARQRFAAADGDILATRPVRAIETQFLR
ncbi:MAG: cytochrome c oxidase subunit II [Alphaproteobacteria bacterium]